MQKLHKKKQNKMSGFTLVELIVSLGLFTVVLMISMGALLSLSDTNRKVKTMRITMDNINLAMESMSREARMGSVYTCNPASLPVTITYGDTGYDCDVQTGGASSFAFLSQDGYVIVYRLVNGVVQRSKDGGSIFSDMTAADINITNLKFYVIGTGSGTFQPRVLISIAGTAGGGSKSSSSFNVQTTVTQMLPK